MILKMNLQKKIYKYIRRMFTVLVCFGIPSSFLMEIAEPEKPLIQMFVNAVASVVTGRSFTHLWYIYIMIGLYFCLPVLDLFIKNTNVRYLKILLCVLFIVDFFCPFVKRITGFNIAFILPFSYFVFYFLAGYYIKAYSPRIINNAFVDILGFFFCCILIIIIYLLSSSPASWITYDSPLIAVMAIFFFSFFALSFSGEPKEIIWKIDRLCFGVYVIHPFFIQSFYRVIGLTPVTFASYKSATFLFVSLFSIMSFIGSYLLRKAGILI